MGNKKLFILSLITTCLMFFLTQTAMAGPDWQEKQRRMFAGIPVKPGDAIDRSNWEKVKDLLPEPVVRWVKDGEWVIKVGEFKYDFNYVSEWYALSAKNAGRYGLGLKKEIIDLKTGKFPLFISGLPFPDVDVKNDPDGATKLMHNNNLCLQMNASFDAIGGAKAGGLQWIGEAGIERGIGITNQRYYYWNRPDGEQPNPNEYMHTTAVLTSWPYDLTGTSSLYIRYLDGRSDMVYAYVPAIRRIKRLSGANRSDPQMGSDMCMDDADGYSGHVEAMKWTYMDEKIVLCPKWEEDMKRPRILREHKTGGWESFIADGQRSGWEEPGWPGLPWAFTNTLWAPREVWIVKAEPLDPYYAYGTLILYVDKLTRLAMFNIKYNRAGEYWKMVVNEHPMTQIPDPKYGATVNAFNLNGPMVVVDERTRHASTTPTDEIFLIADSPLVTARNHTPQAMRTWTK